jgi:hypothetical protein
MMAASFEEFSPTFLARSSMSINPALVATVTTFRPAKIADAGFVPCAEVGIRQISLFGSFFS